MIDFKKIKTYKNSYSNLTPILGKILNLVSAKLLNSFSIFYGLLQLSLTNYNK